MGRGSGGLDYWSGKDPDKSLAPRPVPRSAQRLGSQLGSASPPCCSPTLTACQASAIQASEFPLPLSVAGIIITRKDNKGPGCLKPCNGAVLRLLLPLPGLGRDQPYTIRIMAISGSSPSLPLPQGWRDISSWVGARRSEVLG